MWRKVVTQRRLNRQFHYSCNSRDCLTRCWIFQKLFCSPEIIASMLRDIEATFEENLSTGDNCCDCCFRIHYLII